MVQAAERLFVIALFVVLAGWFANDLRHHLRDVRVRLWRTLFWRPEDATAIRERDPVNYWAFISLKSLAVVAALILAMTYFYVSMRV